MSNIFTKEIYTYLIRLCFKEPCNERFGSKHFPLSQSYRELWNKFYTMPFRNTRHTYRDYNINYHTILFVAIKD